MVCAIFWMNFFASSSGHHAHAIATDLMIGLPLQLKQKS
jgi:hypothetical protein